MAQIAQANVFFISVQNSFSHGETVTEPPLPAILRYHWCTKENVNGMFRLSGLFLDRQILTLKLQYFVSGKFTTTLSEDIRCPPLSYLFGPIFKSRIA